MHVGYTEANKKLLGFLLREPKGTGRAKSGFATTLNRRVI
jgi:hypothetical protein